MRSNIICVVLSTLFIFSSLSGQILDTSQFESNQNEGDSSLQPIGSPFASGDNTSLGWFAQGSGPFDDAIEDSVSFQNGTTAVVGTFQSYIDFSFEFPGVQSGNGQSDIDFFIAWLDENGTWTANIGGGSQGMDSLNSIEKLSTGEIVVSGTYCYNTVENECSLSLDGLAPLNKTNDDDDGNVFLAKMSAQGDWLWVTHLESTSAIYEFSLMVDEQDNIHLGAIYSGILEFNNQILAGGDQPSLVIAIFDQNGQEISAINAVSPQGIELIGSLCGDELGNTYVALTYFEEVMFDQIMLNGSGYADIAIARYDSTGWLWAQGAGGQSEDMAWDCDGSQSGVVVVGDYQGNASFGNFTTDSSQWVDGFIVSLSMEGEWQSLQKISGIGSDRINSVLVNQHNEITIAGITTADLTIGQDLLTDLDGNSDVYHYDVFLAHAYANQTWRWAINAGGQGNDGLTSMNEGPKGSPTLTIQLFDDGVFGAHQAQQQSAMDIGVWAYDTDLDGDGIVDGADNCPRDSNPLQENYDGDTIGDLCDLDDDNDGVEDDQDSCQYGEWQWQSNSQSDHDGDGCHDSTEDYDDDEDGVFDNNDLCPLGPLGWVSTPEEDIEGDGCADLDSDEDGFVDQMDNCPSLSNPLQSDLDGDQIGDICDSDKDGDGIDIPQDLCPHDLNIWISSTLTDHDGDGCQDSVNDYDDDADSVLDINDYCPIGYVGWANESSELDHDGDGCHDLFEDDDDDADGFDDDEDYCPKGLVGISSGGQDEDMDGCIDSAEDDDDDNDGVVDLIDQCPRTPKLTMVSGSGCSQYQLDDDNDGVVNAEDICLNSKEDVAVDEQGCEKLVVTKAPTQNESESSLFNLTNFLFLLALLMGVAALYISTMKPKISQTKVAPTLNPITPIQQIVVTPTQQMTNPQVTQVESSAEE